MKTIHQSSIKKKRRSKRHYNHEEFGLRLKTHHFLAKIRGDTPAPNQISCNKQKKGGEEFFDKN